MIDFEKLKAPFPPDRVSWRVGSLTKDKSKAMALAYVDARDVMERLDEVCTPAGWQCKYSHANGKTVCDIGILISDGAPNFNQLGMGISRNEWIWKADGAGDSDIEAEKGALSDAFKRAAVRWGIGRYLYDIKTPWVTIDDKKNITDTELMRLENYLPNADSGVKFTAPAGLSKTPAKFWDKPTLMITLPGRFIKELGGSEWSIEAWGWWKGEFRRGVEKAPNRDLLAKFQSDNQHILDQLPAEETQSFCEACAVRAEQFKEYA